ncbi:MAG: hypothetical protein QOI35_3985, partial [Cryptosporangiaceae bacterium]|nr:hypothetical protein [Cryptosporangiaceae bacterium]
MDGEADGGHATPAPSPGWGWPLRRYLAVLVALFVLTSGTGAWYTWVQSEHDALMTALDDAQFGAQQAARQIGDAITQVKATVTQLSANPGIGHAFATPKDCQLAFSLTGSGADGGHLDLVRRDGTVACSSRPDRGAASGYAGESWVSRASLAPMTAGPVPDRRTGRPALIIAVPVPGRGAVAAFVDLATLGRSVGDIFGGPRHLMFLVLDRKAATVITRSADASRWIGAAVSATQFANRPGTGSDVDVNGVRRVYGQATVPGPGWQVNAGADRGVALAYAHRLVRRQGLILGGGLIAGLVGTWLVYRRITRPIARLTTAVRAAAGGGGPATIRAGGPREVAALGADFTELVATVGRELDERRLAERNYRQLFGSNPHPMYVLDTGTLALLEVNDASASYYGYSREELLRLDATALSLPEDAAAVAEAVTAASGTEQWASIRQVKRDGTVVTVNVTSHPLSFRGRPARCAVIEDITEKEQLERRLRQSQRLESLGQLAGGVAHDFNNLLGVMIGYATMCAQDIEVIAMTDPTWQRLHADLGQILQAGDRAANVTRQLLAFARHDVPQTQVIDLNDIVTGVEQLLRRSIGEDIDLRTSLAASLWPIKADPGQLEQVLLNLAVNARDAMPSGGTLTIDTERITVDEHYAAHNPGMSIGPHVRLRVSDTGSGMSQETIDRAFEPFFTTKP